jgi:hypothetical protein
LAEAFAFGFAAGFAGFFLFEVEAFARAFFGAGFALRAGFLTGAGRVSADAGRDWTLGRVVPAIGVDDGNGMGRAAWCPASVSDSCMCHWPSSPFT